ncbi:Methyltransferase, FkbM family OS=Oscillatoria acuminata PCC 6304 GN=Oscil6304_3683 PE=4 SV=1: Methyltransf_21 [Gemmataceae bacterium]|nr:Methyltransferase, FkbM family OS=Oscillatoria acuminata PCC 6304 GN=Oscil6304_3683 PE=4 SV=1: Methyltransf_21 [Gemmataceae bacterium]VTU00933.1 Methyltransferase, FkbM family OS=Oscillatoria acuminata PCC 6304 GN=Oscil6304_3683 PE=4 SV=1: Methyltransf_21 [Gemmataceae bacterium]
MLTDRLIELLRPVQFKGKVRLLNPLVPRAGTRTGTVHGARMSLDLAEHIQRMVYLGAYERTETRLIRRYLQPGMNVVDVGANVGYYSLLAARRVGATGRVLAVEPSAVAADRLAATIKDNAIPNIHVERVGLGQSRGEAILFDPRPDNHSPTMLGDPGGAGRVVPIRTLDEVTAECGLTHIDLLKIDVEGYEPRVFAGAEELFAARRIRAVLCEFNEFWLVKGGTTGAAVYRDLLDRGFVDRTGGQFVPGGDLGTRFLELNPREPHCP